jgi:hypothetical protein
MSGDENSKATTNLDFQLIERPINTLLAAAANTIERACPVELSRVPWAQPLFLVAVRVATVTYRTIRHICANLPKDHASPVEYSISVPPLNRSVLDIILTLMFILEDPDQRCGWYFKAGWRESRLNYEKHLTNYGDSPDWQPWLTVVLDHLHKGKAFFGITPDQEANPSTIPSWPNPGAMKSYGVRKDDATPAGRNFMKYLDDWYYKELSVQSHLSAFGFETRGGILIKGLPPDEDATRELQRFRSIQVSKSVTLTMIFLSELELGLHLGFQERIKYVWTILAAHALEAKEIYELRYASAL